MNTVAHCEGSKTRAKHHSWSNDVSRAPLFANVITLDPDCALETWQRLSINTAVVEFQEMPVRLHRALVKALGRSRRIRER